MERAGRRDGADGVQEEGDQLEIGYCHLSLQNLSSAHYRKQDQKEAAQRPFPDVFDVCYLGVSLAYSCPDTECPASRS